MKKQTHYQILIIGGGTAGIMVSAQLKLKNPDLSIAIIEPSESHYYQPAFTLVGGGTYKMEDTRRSEASLIPKGVDWIKDYATAINAEGKIVSTKNNDGIRYDYLVVAAGLVNDLTLIEGLEDAVKKGVVCSNYIDPEYTWKLLKDFKGGNAIFTLPDTPIKCGGAPQKIMYLAADLFRKKGLTNKTNVVFASPGSVIFGVKKIAVTLLEVIDRYGINFKSAHNPVKIDADKKIIYFKDGTSDAQKALSKKIAGSTLGTDNLIAVPFDFLHLAPPQVAPDFIRNSELVNADGWLEVDIYSMQHKQYKNIFGLGDVAALPTAKTGAAIRKQAPVVVDNILKMMNNEPADNKSYDGYSSCPLVTGYGKMVLAEFNYKNEFTPDPMLKFMFVTKSYKEHWRLWLLKKYMLPYMYWNKMMKGKM